MNNKKPFGRVVVLKENENISQALRRFKKKVEDSGVLEELRDREHYIKPTTARKKAKAAAKARWNKKLRENELPKKMF
jgi:small subunit ribosomal protein S21